MEGVWMYVGVCIEDAQGVWRMHMDGWKESESQDQRWKRMMNIRWKYGSYVWKSGMDGACPQCRVQVEEEK